MDKAVLVSVCTTWRKCRWPLTYDALKANWKLAVSSSPIHKVSVKYLQTLRLTMSTTEDNSHVSPTKDRVDMADSWITFAAVVVRLQMVVNTSQFPQCWISTIVLQMSSSFAELLNTNHAPNNVQRHNVLTFIAEQESDLPVVRLSVWIPPQKRSHSKRHLFEGNTITLLHYNT